MRYYNFALYATSDEIKEKTTINLREYGYDNTLIAVFSYDEMNVTFRDAYASITAMLGEVFFVKRIKSDPEEITMYQMLDYINEAKRREYMSWSAKYLESIKLQVCNYYMMIVVLRYLRVCLRFIVIKNEYPKNVCKSVMWMHVIAGGGIYGDICNFRYSWSV